MAVAFGGVAAGYIAAIVFGDVLVPPLRTLLGFPDLVLLGLARALIGLLCYFAVVGLGAVLFKKTNQQGVGLLRLLYGLSGGVLGLLLGVCVVGALIVSVRLVGTIAQGRGPTREKIPTAGKRDPVPGLAEYALRTSADWKKEIEDSAVGPIVKVADPVTAREYEVLAKTGRVLERPEAMRRFYESPAVKQLAKDPRMQALITDPEIAKLAGLRDYAAILRQPKFVEFLNDPAVISQLKALDLEAALNYALPENPATAQPPSTP